MERLNEAIRLSACEYCEAKAYAPCVSFRGRDTQFHMVRVHAAHVLLAEMGIPDNASELIAQSESKGQTRKDWNRRQREKIEAEAILAHFGVARECDDVTIGDVTDRREPSQAVTLGLRSSGEPWPERS